MKHHGIILSCILGAVIAAGAAAPLFSYTWYLEGTWDYYYLTGGTGVPFSNTSNSEMVYKKTPRGVIMKNTATLKTIRNDAPYPVTVTGEEARYLKSDYHDEKDRAYLKELASSIIGDAPTVNAAVEKISRWVRNNVTYQLGAPMDAIGVIKSKKAFCVGYGNVTAELLIAAGLPAKSLHCYVPPKCGWGFGNNGGGHAFIEYFHPKAGWLCVDPQLTLNFADPYHIMNNEFKSEVARVDDMYIVDFQEEPKAWPVYRAVFEGKQAHPAFIFKIRNSSGTFELDDAVVSFKHIPSSNFFGGGHRDLDGMKIDVGGSMIRAITSNRARRFTLILTDAGYFDKDQDEVLSVTLKSCLAVIPFRFKGISQYHFDIDFTDAGKVKRILFRDEKGGALKNAPVLLTVQGIKYPLFTDQKGAVHCIVDAEMAEASFAEKSYSVSFAKSKTVRVPPGRQSGDPAEAYLSEKSITRGPALVCSLYDETGVPCADAFDSITLFGKNQPPVSIKAEAPGVAYFGSKSLKGDMWLLLSAGNLYIKKAVSFTGDEIVKLAVDPGKERFTEIVSNEPSFIAKADFYEYYGGKSPMKYPARDNRIEVSFPQGEYVLSDNPNGEGLAIFPMGGAAAKRVYDRSGLTLDDFIKAQKAARGNADFAAGVIRHEGEIRTGGALWIYDTADNSMVKNPMDGDGFFLMEKYRENRRYRLFYYEKGLMVTKEFAVTPGAAGLLVDTAALKNRAMKTFSGGGMFPWQSPLTFIHLVPAFKNFSLTPISQKVASDESGMYRVFCDTGDFFFSPSGRIDDAVLISAKDGNPPDNLPRNDELFGSMDERFRVLSAIYPKENPCLIARIKDKKGIPLRNKTVSLHDGKTTRNAKTDMWGFIFAENIVAGKTCTLTYSEPGICLVHIFKHPGQGVLRESVELGNNALYSFKVDKHDGHFYRAVPYIDRGALAFRLDALRPDANGKLSLYSNGEERYFKVGSRGMLVMAQKKGTLKVVDCESIKDDQYQVYADIAKTLAAESTVLIFRLFRGRELQEGYQAKLIQGTTRPIKVGDKGVGFAGDIEEGSTRFVFGGGGGLVDKTISVKNGLNILTLDMERDSLLRVECPGRRSIVLYRNPTMEGGRMVSYDEKYSAQSDDEGKCFITVDPGVYHLETSPGQYRKFVLNAGSRKTAILR